MSETFRELDMKMKGYYNNNNNINSPNESMPKRYLRSGTRSDHDFSPSPNHSCPIVNPHKSGSSKSSTSSKSPLSTVKSLEDDVLVMDGILVDSNKASKSSGNFRSSATSDSSSNSGTNLYRTEICVSWENTGSCRYGYKCQFAHGKEELRPVPNRGRPKIKSDYIIVDPYYSPQSSTSSDSSKLAADTMSASSSGVKEAAIAKFSKLEIQQKKHAPTSSPKITTSSDSSMLATDTVSTSSSAAKDAALSEFNKLEIQQPMDPMSLRRKIMSTDWSPLDDGIIPSSFNETFSRKAVDEYINQLLYGPAVKKRLPVFVDICPE